MENRRERDAKKMLLEFLLNSVESVEKRNPNTDENFLLSDLYRFSVSLLLQTCETFFGKNKFLMIFLN